MRKNSIYIIFLLSCLHYTAVAQQNSHIGYKIDGDDVIFTFDVRDYKKATKDNTAEQLDFSDLEVYNVAVSGEFNNWSRNQWKMKKTGAYTYELRKKLSDLDHAFSWEFKFIVNEKYWAEPKASIKNVVWAKKDDFWLSVYNLKMYTVAPSENGNAYFYLKDYPNAKKVILTGTFNQWNEDAFEMKKTPKGWELKLQLSPGDYEYKFIVDGKWIHDPYNAQKKRNQFLTYNSIITITKPVQFNLNGFKNAEKVILSGSFNNWDTQRVVMTKTNSGWSATVDLKGGKMHYKYIVDGKWITDPDNPIQEYDEYGHVNSVKMID